MQKAFTLIELLVVVLIIGILSAVALPQYRISVEKARAAEALIMVRSIAKANQLYYIANGNYADSLDDLDIGVPGTQGTVGTRTRIFTQYFQYDVKHSDGGAALAIATRLPFQQAYAMYIRRESPQTIVCDGYSSLGISVCKNLSGSTETGTTFIIQ